MMAPGRMNPTMDVLRPPWWYWAAAIIAVLWTLLGVVAWTMDLTMDAEAIAELTPAQQSLYAVRPQWVFVLYGVAVFSAFAGAIGLLLRKRWVTTLFLVSLAAVVVQFAWILFGMDAIGVMGAGEALPFPMMIVLFAVFLLWFARYARRHGWI